MNFSRALSSIFLILLLPFGSGGRVFAAEAADNQKNWEEASPLEIHRQMWETKASAHLERQRARALAAGEAAVSTQTNYDVLFYDIYIRVNDTTEIIYGRVKFVAQAAQDGVTAVEIDFFDNMMIDSIVAPSGPLSYSRLSNVVTVTLDDTYNTGQQFSFDFYYHGHPIEGGFQAFAFDYRLGKPVIATLSEPYYARTWWPCKDRMDDKADSFNIAIEIDTSLYVGSNGTLDSTVANGGNTHTFYYSVRYPMVTYLFSLAISNYTVWYDQWVYNGGLDTMPIVNAVYPDRYAYSLTKFNITPGALTVFSDNFGQYPFVNEKYGHANFEWNGAMEHQTMSSMTGTDFGFATSVVVHELSHQWFGDMITCKSWGDIWLNEGWASYCEAIYFQATQGWSGYHNWMNGMDYAGGGTIYVYDTTYIWNIFSSLTYDKAAWVLHMLRGVLGDTLFFVGVNAYTTSQFRHAAATTEDFKNVMESASGVQLDWFFDEWIYGTYRPNYYWTYYQEPSDTGGYDVYLRVEQKQTTPPLVFTMPVDFFFNVLTGPDDTITLWIDKDTTLHKLNFPSLLSSMQVDPSNWVLKYQSNQVWKLYIVTLDGELHDGQEFLPYRDTIKAPGGTGSNTWSIVGGALPTGYGISSQGIITGTTSDTGLFTFTVLVDDNGSNYSDQAQLSIYVAPTVIMPGDVDNDAAVNIADLTYFVAYFFQGGDPP
ncbi:MAG TPA: M1 family metallopeptidase, partial [Candidatus Deferrimicrobium sp.]|nr:M1 family metallopeptidase [Candidatus Deferrimicrobium sp.]